TADGDVVITGDADVGGVVSLEATGDISLAAVTAGSTFVLDAGGDITFDIASTGNGNIQITAGGDIVGGLADTSDANVIASGTDGVILRADGNLTIGTATAQDNVQLFGAQIDAGVVRSDFGTASITATQNANIGTITSSSTTTVTGASITLDRSNTAALTLNATSGDLVITDDLVANSAVNLDASGDIRFESIAGGSTFTGDAGGDILFDTATTSNGNLQLIAGGILTGTLADTLTANTIASGTDAVILRAGDNLTIGTATAQDNVQLVGTRIDAGTVRSEFGSATVTATQDVDIDAITSNIGTTVTGTAITLGQVSSNGLTLNATVGDLVLESDAVSNGAVNLDAAGNIQFERIDAASTFTVDAIGDIVFDTATTSNGNIQLTAEGNITGVLADTDDANTIASGTDSIALSADGDLSIQTVSAQDGVQLAASAINVETVLARFGAIAVTAAQTADVGSAQSRTTTTITGADVLLGQADVSGLTLDAIVGDVEITGDAISANFVNLDAERDIRFESIAAGSTFTADAGADVVFGSATTTNGNIQFNAGGALTGSVADTDDANTIASGNDSVILTAVGALSIDQATAQDAVQLTGGSVNSGLASSAFSSVAITAALDSVVDTANSATTTTITGANVTLDNAEVSGLTIDATVGNINGTGTIISDSFVNLDAVGDVSFGSISAGSTFTLDVNGNITFDAASTSNGNIQFTATGDITGGSLDTDDANTIASGNDAIIVTAGGDLTLDSATAQDIAQLTGDRIEVGTVSAAVSSIVISAAQDALVGTANSALSASITGANVTLDNAEVSGLTLDATDGSISGTGTIISDSFANLDATQNIAFGTLSAGSTLTLDVAGNITFDAASTTNGNLQITAGGDILAGSVNTADISTNASGNDAIALTAGGLVRVDSAQAQDALTLNGGSVDAGSLTSDRSTIAVTAAQDAVVGTVNSQLTTTIRGANVTLDNAAVSGLTLDATNGSVSGTGDIVSDSFANLDATQNIAFGTLSAGSTFTLDVDGNITFDTATTTNGNIQLTAGGDITGGLLDTSRASASGNDAIVASAGGTLIIDEARAQDAVQLSGGTVAAGTLVSDNTLIQVTATQDASVDSAITPTTLTIRGASAGLNGGDIGTTLTLDAQSGNARIAALGDQQILVGGAANIDAVGDFLISHTSNANAVETLIATGALTIDVGGNIVAQAGTLLASEQSVAINAAGAITLDRVRDGGALTRISGDGGVTLSTIDTQEVLFNASGGTVAVTGDLLVDETVTINSQAVDLSTTSDLTIDATATAGDINVATVGLLRVIGADATGSVSLDSTGSNAVIEGATGSAIALEAAGTLSVDGAVAATNGLTLDAEGVVAINAQATGGNILVRGADLAIADAAALGDETLTQRVEIVAVEEAQIGGVAGGSGVFEIDNAEFGRIHSGGDIAIGVVAVSPGGGAQLSVADLDA
ncbi:MAG: hypothetical protein AAFN48_04440, partial [Pseudomonadota bacterium]